MNFRKLMAVTVVGSLTSVAMVSAQDQSRPAAQRTQGSTQGRAEAGQQIQWQNPDHVLASCVAIGNQEEIAIAKFAQEKAKSQAVKDYAKMLVNDHQQFLQKLQRYAPEASREGYLMDGGEKTASNGQPRTNRPNEGGAQVNVQAGGVNVSTGQIQQTSDKRENIQGQAGQHIDFMALHRELAENCLSQAKEGMSKKEGKKFDECFIGHQIAKHEEMKNKLTVFKRHASPEVGEIFAAGLQTTEQHLKKAEEIMKQLDSDSKKDRDDSK